MNVWITELELPDHVTGIRCDNPEAEDEYDASGRASVLRRNFRGITNGTIPMAARTEGSDRIPSDTVSAIMTEECEHPSCCFKASKAGIDTHAGLPGAKISSTSPEKIGKRSNSPPRHRPVLDLGIRLVPKRVIFVLRASTTPGLCPSFFHIIARFLFAVVIVRER